MRSKSIKRMSVDITFMLNAPCNFQCSYCCTGWGNEVPPKIGVTNINKELLFQYLNFVDAFDSPRKVVRLSSYGETTLVPGIWDFISELSTRAKIMLVSNLTFNLAKLYQAVSPESVLFILTSLHPKTEENIESFVAKCKELIDHGYFVIVHYMVDDKRIEKAEEYEQLMKKHNIPYFMSPIQGNVNNAKFPYDFKITTKEFLSGNIDSLHPQLLLKYRDLAFTGMSCSAGFDTFCVKNKAVIPCMNSDVLLGWIDKGYRILSKPSECLATHASAQCLPDAFLPFCKSYCMGEHSIESSPELLQPFIKEFEKLYQEVVLPSLSKLSELTIENIKKQLNSIKQKVYVLFFGMPIWPYLSILRKCVEIEGIVLTTTDEDSIEGVPVISLERYLAIHAASSLLSVVLYSIHAAPQAMEFLSVNHKIKSIVLKDLPVHLQID